MLLFFASTNGDFETDNLRKSIWDFNPDPSDQSYDKIKNVNEMKEKKKIGHYVFKLKKKKEKRIIRLALMNLILFILFIDCRNLFNQVEKNLILLCKYGFIL